MKWGAKELLRDSQPSNSLWPFVPFCSSKAAQARRSLPPPSSPSESPGRTALEQPPFIRMLNCQVWLLEGSGNQFSNWGYRTALDFSRTRVFRTIFKKGVYDWLLSKYIQTCSIVVSTIDFEPSAYYIHIISYTVIQNIYMYMYIYIHTYLIVHSHLCPTRQSWVCNHG